MARRFAIRFAISSALLATGIALSLSTPALAEAAKSYAYHATKINLNGKQVSAPYHISAMDPFGGANAKETSFVPIWYIDTALHGVGITTGWDGHTLKLGVLSSITVQYPVTPKTLPLSSTVMAIQINGKVVTYAPMIKYSDAGSKTITTFVPVFYLEKTLGNMGIQTGWDGTTWSMTMSTTSDTTKNKTAPKQVKTYPDGWTAPVLTESWNSSLSASNQAGEFALFKNELGFSNNGSTYSIPGEQDVIIVQAHTFAGHNSEVALTFSGWGPGSYDPNSTPGVPDTYRIPVIAKQLFNFYFGSDSQKVWDYFNTNKVPTQFTANGRTCYASYSDATGELTLDVGYPASK